MVQPFEGTGKREDGLGTDSGHPNFDGRTTGDQNGGGQDYGDQNFGNQGFENHNFGHPPFANPPFTGADEHPAGDDQGRADPNGYIRSGENYAFDPQVEPFAAAAPGAFGQGHDSVTAETPAHTGLDDPDRLDLGDDVRLPWLEGDDEDEDVGGSGIGQGVILLGLGLLAICLIVGVVIWATRERKEEQLVAEGGVIAAPATPYKVRPKDPGGEVVDGTGDSSFAVAEGQSRPARIDAMNGAQPGFVSVGGNAGGGRTAPRRPVLAPARAVPRAQRPRPRPQPVQRQRVWACRLGPIRIPRQPKPAGPL